MATIQSSYALVKGCQLCFSDRQIRRLSIWPWIIGIGAYLATAVAAVYLFSPLLGQLVLPPAGFWSGVWYYIVAIFLGAFLSVATVVVTLTLVIVLTGFFQSSIAALVLKQSGITVVSEGSIVSEAGRTIVVEGFKLLWLLPLIVVSFLLFFIPLLFPFAILLSAWLLAYQFVDVVLDTLRFSAGQRLRFGLRNWSSLFVFGLTLMFIGIVPLIGIIIPPIAVAGAAWLLASGGLLHGTQVTGQDGNSVTVHGSNQ